MLFFENSIGILNWERRGPYLHPVPFLISQTCNLLNHASNHIISHFKSLISPSSIISQSHFLVHFFPILTSVFQMSFFMLSGMFCNFNLHDLDFRQLSHVLSVLLAHICVGSKIFEKQVFFNPVLSSCIWWVIYIYELFLNFLCHHQCAVYTQSHPNPLMA